MSLEDREIRWINPFGPIIVETTISDKLHNILLTRADQIRNGNHPNPAITKDTNDYRDRLAGNLSEEYSYAGAFTEDEDIIITKELEFLAKKFIECAKNAGKNIGKFKTKDYNDLSMQKPLWVNYMKSGEWNPAHNHTGDVSCVTYLRVPKEIEEENKTGKHTSKSNTPSAGRIEWQFGNTGMSFSSGGYIRIPQDKKIYFFPAALSHLVYPFKSNVERVSVSCNFSVEK